MSYRILLVDDDHTQAKMLEQAIGDHVRHQTTIATSGQEAIDLLTSNDSIDFDLVLLDLSMPGIDGLEVLHTVRPVNPSLPVVVCTAHDDVDSVIGAMKAGATDFIRKDEGVQRLRVSIHNALRINELNNELARLKRNIGGRTSFSDIIGESDAVRYMLSQAEKVATSQLPVSIEGASGSGKELLARAIHAASDRAEKPFIAVNCGAFVDQNVEGILFGHEKDAFPGALYKTFGKLREADTGSIFLDEITELRPDIQMKLLKVLQTGIVNPVGSDHSVKVNVRFIVASHINLENAMKEGKFREDLYYRLQVFPISVPLLRERNSDIPLLIKHYAEAFALSEGKRVDTISPSVFEMAESYPWPGNIRQLKNAVFRAVVLCDDGELTVDDFPQIKHSVISHANTSGNVVPIKAFAKHSIINIQKSNGELKELHEIEKEVIACAIAQCEGNLSAVATKLGIGRSTLYRKLYEYGLEPKKNSHTPS